MSLSVETLAVAKKYTDDSMAGAGAVAGVPCQIQSKTPITGGTRITFLWVDNNGDSHTTAMDVMNGIDGQDGKGIQSVSVNDENHLMITYTDGTKVDAGQIEIHSAVDSVNGQTGAVVLDAEAVGALPVNTPIPSKTSNLTNDSGFITKAVNDLVSYYLKSETYSKTQVDDIVTAVKNSRFEVVATLPTTDIKTNVIYLVPKSPSQTSNVKDEYINLDGTTSGWEKIGDTEIDLSDYVTTEALNTALAAYTTTADLTTLLAAKADKVSGATNGNFAGLDASGNLKDSGKKASDFATPTDIQNLYADNGLLGAKNLLPTPYYSTKGGKITSGTLTVTENADGSVKINGTASGQSYVDLANNDKFLKAGTYILSGGLTSKQYVYINCLNNGTYVRTLVSATTSEAEFVLDYNGYDAITVGISIAGGESLDNVTFYPMIRLASNKDSSYKPYAKTNRQLTKDSVTWDDLSEVGAVNRLKGTLTQTKTVDTHTFTPNSDGSITITNTGVTTSTPLAQKIGQFVGDGSVVKLSGGISGGSSETYCLQVQEGSTWKFIYDTGNGAIFQTVSGTTYGIYVVVRNGYSVSGTVYPMIADVSYNGSYVPYARTNKELTDDAINLQNTKQDKPASNMAFARYIEWQGADTTRRLTMTANRARKTLLLMDNQNVAFVYFNEASAPIIVKVNGFADLTITLVSGTLRDHGTAVYDITGLTVWGSHVIVDFAQYTNGNANDELTLSAVPTP